MGLGAQGTHERSFAPAASLITDQKGDDVMPNGEQEQIATVFWLLQGGGVAPLIWGLILALIGIVPVIRPNFRASIFLGFLSLSPAVFGMIGVYTAATEYAEMAAFPNPPKPSDFAATTGRAMSCSFCAVLGSFLAMFVATLAMWRSNQRSSTDEGP